MAKLKGSVDGWPNANPNVLFSNKTDFRASCKCTPFIFVKDFASLPHILKWKELILCYWGTKNIFAYCHSFIELFESLRLLLKLVQF